MGAFEYEIRCYRCRESEAGERSSDVGRDTAIETFKTTHRSKCGATASFVVSRSFRHRTEKERA